MLLARSLGDILCVLLGRQNDLVSVVVSVEHVVDSSFSVSGSSDIDDMEACDDGLERWTGVDRRRVTCPVGLSGNSSTSS